MELNIVDILKLCFLHTNHCCYNLNYNVISDMTRLYIIYIHITIFLRAVSVTPFK
jgi:hypothetical protein